MWGTDGQNRVQKHNAKGFTLSISDILQITIISPHFCTTWPKTLLRKLYSLLITAKQIQIQWQSPYVNTAGWGQTNSSPLQSPVAAAESASGWGMTEIYSVTDGNPAYECVVSTHEHVDWDLWLVSFSVYYQDNQPGDSNQSIKAHATESSGNLNKDDSHAHPHSATGDYLFT